ncbi:hypothetical protein [Mycoplasma sp. 'Moose RK']|uniref:hypothetical protein n=1 Tax=Mycoplasma sp. 'Moose RK' TaxID=2780095 RepID=UPI0018C2BBCF|nr:hypothetical protein [Mycoplasma sp. 'Moose RK']MBG0730934.1 hypothetical protein [Mycoplasma sp. 'Moose RK']
MKLKIFYDHKNKCEIKKFIKNEVKFRHYKQVLGKKFSYLFYYLSKILVAEIPNSECAMLDLKLISNIDKIETWISCVGYFSELNLKFNIQICKSLATFLYYSWKIYLQKFKFKPKLFNYEHKRRNAFNLLSLEWIKIDSEFNKKIIAILKRWK